MCNCFQYKQASQNKRNADLFKCSEMVTSISNWITTVELKLASDDDRYLDDAMEENHSYKVIFFLIQNTIYPTYLLVPRHIFLKQSNLPLEN